MEHMKGIKVAEREKSAIPMKTATSPQSPDLWFLTLQLVIMLL